MAYLNGLYGSLTPYGIYSHMAKQMKAELLFHERIDYDDGGIVELVLWREMRDLFLAPLAGTFHRTYSDSFRRAADGRHTSTTAALLRRVG